MVACPTALLLTGPISIAAALMIRESPFTAEVQAQYFLPLVQYVK
jgi:hypothetical protein